ncbi:cytoskeleton-associated protein 2-like [Scyliorhinus canicula]|uniref:cytoskeleton-associated protein 2-like n=1 Tax=Scyliorhinus canicula TaxID=7830 RepID=UPI0018F620F0|nr:cytoskeleton-associated protein 2-like [Scyliorhinus canicula]
MAAERRSSRVRLEESEFRRQQLEAYLSRKGKLKVPGPNARYYLGDKTNRKTQPPTAPFKVGVGGALKSGGPTKPTKLRYTNHSRPANHVTSLAVTSLAASSKTQPNTETSKAKETLSKTAPAFPQAKVTAHTNTPTLFPAVSTTGENEPPARAAHSDQYEGNLNPATLACAANLRKSDYPEQSKQTVDMAPNRGHSVSTALIKPFTNQAIKTQDGRSKNTVPDNRLRAIGTGRTAKMGPGAAKLTGMAKPTSSVAKPAGTAKVAHGAGKPVGTAKVAHGAGKPVGTAKVSHGAGKLVSTAKMAHGAGKHVGTAKVAHGAGNKPVSTAKTAHGAGKPVSTAKAAYGAGKPVSTAKVAHGTGKPVGVNPKQSTNGDMDQNDGDKRLNYSTQRLASDKTKPGTGLQPPIAIQSTGKKPVTIWQPFTRSTQRIHECLVSRNTKGSKGGVPTPSALSTAKCQRGESTVHPTGKGQGERRKRLDVWLASKGKTYKRPPMPTPLQRSAQSVKKNLELSFWEAIEEEEVEKSLTSRVNHMLDDCMRFVEKGAPPEQLAAALQNIPEGERFAKYWIIRARLLELTGPMEAVIALFEQAVHSGAEPVEELRYALVEAIMRNASSQPASAETEDNETEDCGELAIATPHSTAMKTNGHDSSVIKYRVTATSQVLRGKGTVDRMRSVGKQDVKFLTPVRRSVRIEHVSASHPEILREHDCCVTSLNELLAVEEAATYVYRENRALLNE